MKKIQRLALIVLACLTTLFLPACEGMAPLIVVRNGPSGGEGPGPMMRPQMGYPSGGMQRPPMYGGGGYGGEQPHYYQPNGGFNNGGGYQQPFQQRPVTPYNTYGSRNGSVAHWGPAPIQGWNGGR